MARKSRKPATPIKEPPVGTFKIGEPPVRTPAIGNDAKIHVIRLNLPGTPPPVGTIKVDQPPAAPCRLKKFEEYSEAEKLRSLLYQTNSLTNPDWLDLHWHGWQERIETWEGTFWLCHKERPSADVHYDDKDPFLTKAVNYQRLHRAELYDGNDNGCVRRLFLDLELSWKGVVHSIANYFPEFLGLVPIFPSRALSESINRSKRTFRFDNIAAKWRRLHGALLVRIRAVLFANAGKAAPEGPPPTNNGSDLAKLYAQDSKPIRGKPGRRGYPIEALSFARKVRAENPNWKTEAIRAACLKRFSADDLPPDADSFRRWMNRRRANRAN